MITPPNGGTGGPPNVTIGENSGQPTAPDAFFEPDQPPYLAYEVNKTLPKSEGGPIEAVKRAVVTAIRDALAGMDLRVDGQAVYVDLEYPLKETQYPGVWVQFSPTNLGRAGISQELWVKENGEWCPIREWTFQGRVTLSIVALKSIDRDRLADTLIMNLAFARTPDEFIITKTDQDTRRYRSLLTALDDNPYIKATLNLDVIYPGGQNVTPGVPWQPDVLAYEDSYSFDMIGQFNVKFRHDGYYELARIDIDPHPVASIPASASRNPYRFPSDIPDMFPQPLAYPSDIPDS